MKRSDMVLIISEKIQKQMHLINSQLQREHPKMLCDNLALRVMNSIEEAGMTPPRYVAVIASGKKYVHETDFARDTALYAAWEPEDETT